jgi:hypothetical protein
VPQFVVGSLSKSWIYDGRQCYRQASKLLVPADGVAAKSALLWSGEYRYSERIYFFSRESAVIFFPILTRSI